MNTTQHSRAASAARLLGLRTADATRNSAPVPDLDATCFWDPARGGGTVIVGSDGTYLFAGSAVTRDAHLEAFAAGRRTIGAA